MMIPAVQAIAASPEPRPVRAPRTTTAEPRAAEPRPYVNPTLRLDADAGLVVMEFRDDNGTVTTIPNERQLAAYRAHQEASADLASARNAIETSAAFTEVDGFAEPQLAFGEPAIASAAPGTPATGTSPSPAANPPPLSAAPARLAPPGLLPPNSTPTGPAPPGPATARTAGPVPPGNDGSAPAAGPPRA